MYKDLPKFKISIDPEYSEGEDLGINAIAFTSNPAILTKGFAFSADKPKEKLFFGDKLKKRVVAPAMIPMEIYRCDEEGEYYVQFTESEIEKIHSKFMKNFTNRQVFNLEHDSSEVVPAYVLECWIVDNPTEDKAFTSYGIKVPKGTVMLTAQITDANYYNQLVENEQTGFSIEGFLGLSLSEIINKNKIKEEKMEEKQLLPAGEYPIGDNKILVVAEDGSMLVKEIEIETLSEDKPEEEVKEETLAEELAKLGSDKGDIYFVGPTMNKGKEVFSDDQKTPLEVGEYVLENDLTLVVEEAGIVGELKEVKKEEMSEDKPEEVIEEEMAEEAPVVETYTKEEVDAKFEELYKMIGDLKADAPEVKVEEAVEEVKLTAVDRFAVFNAFTKRNNL